MLCLRLSYFLVFIASSGSHSPFSGGRSWPWGSIKCIRLVNLKSLINYVVEILFAAANSIDLKGS